MGQEKVRGVPLYWNDKPEWSAMRDEKGKAHLVRGEFKFFDLDSDPSESKKLTSELPEVAYKYLKKLQA